MAATTDKAQCVICKKEKNTYECKGCSDHFCFAHLTDHREEINKQFNKIEDDYNSFLQTVTDHKDDLELKQPLIHQLDKWEENAINEIKQTAEEYRQKIIEYQNKYIIEIANKSEKLAEQLKEVRDESEFNEIHINQFKKTLTKLTEELNNPSNISINQKFTPFIGNIFVTEPFETSKVWTPEMAIKFYHDVKSLLNKINPETYDNVVEKLQQFEIKRREQLEEMVNIIYSKAIDKPDIGFLLAKLCKQLHKIQFPVLNEQGKTEPIYFRQSLLRLCQENFESDVLQETDDDERNNKEVKKLDREHADAKRKKLNNIRFIGELFKVQMLTDTIIYDCIEYLLRDKTDEENLECLCHLLSIIGKELDAKANEKPENKDKLEKQYRELNNIMVQREVLEDMCRIIQDLIELRRAGWMTLHGERIQITTDEIRQQQHGEQNRAGSGGFNVDHQQ